jgi:chemotaxis protein MotB
MRRISISRSILSVSAFSLLAGGVVGCVPQEKYQALRIERDALNEQLSQSQSRLSQAEGERNAMKSAMDGMGANSANKDALENARVNRIAELERQNAELTQRYNDAVSKIASGPSLSPVLTTELTQFADANPELVSFDAQSGMMRFKSDVTFASGDAAIQPGAAAVIAKFAEILKSPEASKYDILVAGHADNQPVSAGTVSRGHKDNWYLSAHRALSVAEALRKQGVDGRKLAAAGFGDMRPVADNSSAQGKASNRRVEVVILPKIISGGTASAPVAPAPANIPAEPVQRKMDRPELSK